MKWNLGCGYDIKDGWFNTNYFSHLFVEGAYYLDAIEFHPDMVDKFDYVLINHVLCLQRYEISESILRNVHSYLKEGGVVQVIDLDPIKAFEGLKNKDPEAFPGFEGSIDNRFCRHLIGYGRKSLYTASSMSESLSRCGFSAVAELKSSPHDLRPKESFVVEGIK